MEIFKFEKQNYKHKQAGFTLVELMVSLTIFLIVVLAAVGSLYTVNNNSRKVQAERSVIDNLNFAIESMSRTIRTGNSVSCLGGTIVPPNCPFANQVPGSQILIDSTLGTSGLVEYQLGNNPDGTGTIQKRVQENGVWTNWISITAPEIDVQKLSFYVDGASATDLAQPSVSIFTQGVAVVGESTIPFAVQTYVSQRAAE